MTSKPTQAERMLINSIVQGWILDFLENPYKPYAPLSEGMKTRVQAIYDLLEKDSQRILNPAPKSPRKPSSRTQEAQPAREPLTVADFVPDSYVNPNKRAGKNGRNG
jgi:hypothetical protein